MNHFMPRLIFCFFAQRTDIFIGDDLLTATIEQMSERDSSNTHEVIGELFRAMNTKIKDRASAGIPRWADAFPYMNGELFSGSIDVPRFSRIARSYLLHLHPTTFTGRPLHAAEVRFDCRQYNTMTPTLYGRAKLRGTKALEPIHLKVRTCQC